MIQEYAEVTPGNRKSQLRGYRNEMDTEMSRVDGHVVCLLAITITSLKY